MKKIILLLALLPTIVFGQITNVYIGATPNDGTGDTLPIAFTKINYNFGYFASILLLNSNNLPSIRTNQNWLLWNTTNLLNLTSNQSLTISALQTNGVFTNGAFAGHFVDTNGSTGTATYVPTANGDGTWDWMPPSGGSSGVTNFVFTATNLPPGSSPTSTMIGVTNQIAYIFFGVPAGSNGATYFTNTYYAPSNAMFSSSSFVLLQTNFTFALSNNIGEWTNVVTTFVGAPQIGGGGVAPPSSAAYTVFYSSNDINWFTNLPAAPNVVWIAVTNSAGGAGSIKLTSATYPQLNGQTNDLSLQVTRVAAPANVADATTKYYVDTAIANAVANQWQALGGDYFYGPQNQRVFELYAPATISSTNLSIAISGTNYVLNIATTNFVAGWHVQMSPDLTLINGFTNWTAYTVATNAGIVSFTIPAYLLPPTFAFFRIVSFTTPAVISDWPIQTPYVFFGTNVNYTTNTVSHSTNSTFGFGAGLMTCDTNYFYVSVGTNAWRRISIPTNTW